jgi:hypothetical protein
MKKKTEELELNEVVEEVVETPTQITESFSLEALNKMRDAINYLLSKK